MTAARLPGPMSFAELDTFRRQPALWLDSALEIARSQGIATADPEVFAAGSNLIVGLGGVVLKIFAPMLRHQFVSERASLAQLARRLSVPTPELAAEGERDGWPFLIMTRLAGVTGADVWPDLPEPDKVRLLGRIGELVAELQAVPVGPLASLEPVWRDFVPAQLAGCVDRHRRLGLPSTLVTELPSYLADAAGSIPTDVEPVILTGEFIPENFLLGTDAHGRWQLTGLIDFGDVMTGLGDYDLLGPSAFMAAGVRDRVVALLRGYGVADADMTPALSRRLLTLFLLHRFSNLSRQIAIADWEHRAPTLPALAQLLWPLG